MFLPQGIVPGAPKVPVLWLFHASGSSHDALIGGFRGIGERAVDLGMVAICQNLGGTLYTSAAAQQHQVNGWNYLSGIYGIDRNFFRATSHGGAMATEVLVTAAHAERRRRVHRQRRLRHREPLSQRHRSAAREHREAFGYDVALMKTHNPARHAGAVWNGARVRSVYSQPDSSDSTVPPQVHAKKLVATAKPYAAEASVRTHSSGHTTPTFADSDAQATFSRWLG